MILEHLKPAFLIMKYSVGVATKDRGTTSAYVVLSALLHLKKEKENFK